MLTGAGSPELRRTVYSWLLAIVLPAFAAYMALSSPVEEHSYDAAAFHVQRGVVFSAARAEGTLYPRWVQPINAGLGGPLFSFYSPLSYLAMDALQATGLSAPATWRLLVALALVLASVGVFALALELSRDAVGALTASAVYAYSFPFLRELFERGSPQGFALALYPWVLYALLRFARRTTGLRLLVAALVWAALILTHNLSAAFLIPVFGLVAVLYASHRDWRAVGAIGLAFGCGLLLSSVFLVPSLLERGYVRLDNAVALDYARVAENSIPLETLFGLPRPYDTGLDNNLIGEAAGPLQGLMAVASLGAGIILWIRRRAREAVTLCAFGLLSLVVLWLQTASADPLWRTVPALAYVQARSRLLGLSILSSAIIVAVLVPARIGRWRTGLSLVLIGTSLLTALPVLYPRLQYQFADFEHEITVEDVTTSSLEAGVPGLTAFNEFQPVWRYLPYTVEEARRVKESLFAYLPEGSRVDFQERGMDWARAQFELPAPSDLILHVLYFPGWTGTVDGEARPLSSVEGTGYARVQNVPAGSHTLELRYEGTSIQHAAMWLSVVGAAGLLLAAVLWRGSKDPRQVANYPKARRWVLSGLVLLVAMKALVIDEHTTLFRRSSNCSSIRGAESSMEVQFAERIQLCAVDLQKRTYRPGEILRITLYWQSAQPVEEPAYSFVHLLGTSFNPKTGNPLWGQQDKQLPGYHPLVGWTPGKIYRDHYEFRIDPDSPPGAYQLEVGWVRPSTGLRLVPEVVQETPGVSLSHLDSLLLDGIELRE